MTVRTQDPQLANLIIAGINKAGSTSLFHYLSEHPEIHGSRDKETCYFLPLLYNEPLPPIRDYQVQFSHITQPGYRMEATPGYVIGGEKIASVINRTLPGVKIIIILKDPVDRLVSFYKRKKTTLQLPASMSFSEYVKTCRDLDEKEVRLRKHHLYSALSTGAYSDFLEPWLKTFGNDVKIVFFDDLKKDARKFMKDIAAWLDIDTEFYDMFDFDVKNRSMNYKIRLLQQIAVKANSAGQRFWRTNPGIKKRLMSVYYKINGVSYDTDEIDQASLRFLYNYYRPHNQQLQQLLFRYGMDERLPLWLEPAKVLA